ncbi:MAG: hypothetical protein OEV78_12855 [Spirochaetia bacterium]|nr:hypothetical protein [Spirochaetia bacterium]
MVSNIEKDRLIYKKAKTFLYENSPSDVTDEIIESYLSVPVLSNENTSLKDIYKRLLESAQNANMKAGVISGSIDGIENLSKVLFEFDHRKVLNIYLGHEVLLLSDIIEKLKPRGKIRTEEKSIWPKYCRSITSAAEFLTQFSDSKEFFDWANYFYNDKKSLAALPMIIDAEVYGIAFPLACDFLKELGFINYGKPDVHLKDIFEASGLVPLKSSNYQILKAISRVAESNNETAYNVDKIFWLLGSGYYYNHKHLGKKGRFPRLKEKFIKSLK